jgi:hypothetical protein
MSYEKPTYTESHRKMDDLFIQGKEHFKLGSDDEINELLLKISSKGESLYRICPHLKKSAWVDGWKSGQADSKYKEHYG